MAGGMALGFVLAAQSQIVQDNQTDSTSSTAFDAYITSNLILAGESSLSSATADVPAISGAFSAAGLNDGIADGNATMTYYAAASGNGTYMPNVAVFQLSAGYNISSIQVISGWADHNLGEQVFEVLLSIGGGTYSSIGIFTNNDSVNLGFAGPGSWMTTLTDSKGTIATNVTGIKFIFLNPDQANGATSVGSSQSGDGSTGGTVIHELQVFGTYYTNLPQVFNLANIATDYKTDATSSTAFDSYIANNLIQAGQNSLMSVKADVSALSGSFSSAGLNDGSSAASANMTYYAAAKNNGTIMPATAIFELTAGYNITNIQVISGWADHNLGEQMFQVLLSIGGGAYSSIGIFTNNASLNFGFEGSGSWMTTISSIEGAIATNVTGIEFIFLNPDSMWGAGTVGDSQIGDGSTGGTVFHELQVFGTYYTNLNGVTPTDVIPVTDSNLLSGLTPYNWVCKTNYICSSVGGAGFKVQFQNAPQVRLMVDNSQFSGVTASRYPIVCWSVDGGAYQSHQLAAGESSFVLSTGVTNPVIDLYIKGMSPFEDRYTGNIPANSVKITGFTVSPNATTIAVQKPTSIWLNIGDSIMAGDAALYSAGQGTPASDSWAAADDARASYGYLLAKHFGCQEARLAFGGYDWAGGLGNVPALSKLIDWRTSTVSRLTNGFLNPIPEIALINLGENGAPTTTDVTNALYELRARVGQSTKVIVMVPVSGKARSEVTKAFNSYVSSSHDQKAFLVDLGTITFDTAEGQHPTAQGHQAIYSAALPAMDAIISSSINLTNIVADCQMDPTSTTAFDSYIADNLIRSGQNSLHRSTAVDSSMNGTFLASGLNDGSAAANANMTYYAAVSSSGTHMPATAVFELTGGYNITNIQVISAWADHNLGEQMFQVLLSIGDTTYASIGTFTNNTSIDLGSAAIGSWMTTITGINGIIATNVTGIEFVFMNPDPMYGDTVVGDSQAGDGSMGGTLLHEIQVFGYAANVSLNVQVSTDKKMQLTWPQGTLLQATNITGPWTTNATAISPFTVNPTESQMFYRVKVQ